MIRHDPVMFSSSLPLRPVSHHWIRSVFFMLACFDLSQVTFIEALVAFYLYSLAGADDGTTTRPPLRSILREMYPPNLASVHQFWSGAFF